MVWSGVDYLWIVTFISCLDSQSDGTHSLQSIHWWASDVKLHFSKSVPLKKQTWMAWVIQQIFFGLSNFFKKYSRFQKSEWKLFILFYF